MFRGFSICHIKASAPIGTMLTPVPNFLPLLLFLRATSTIPSIVGGIHQCIFLNSMSSLRQHRRQNQRGAGDTLNPLSQTDDAMVQQFKPHLTPFTPRPVEGSSSRAAVREGAPLSAASRYGERLFNQRLGLGEKSPVDRV